MSSLKEELNSSIDYILLEDVEDSLKKIHHKDLEIPDDRKSKKLLPRQQILLRVNISLRYLKVKNIQAPFNSTIFDVMNDFFDSLSAFDLQKAVLTSRKIFEKSSHQEGLDFLYGYVMSSLYFEHYFIDTMNSLQFMRALREDILSYTEGINLDSHSVKTFISYLFFDDDDNELYMKLDTLLLGRIRNDFCMCLGLLKTLRYLLVPTGNIF